MNNANGKMPDRDGEVRKDRTHYDVSIESAKTARNNQFKDSDPRIEKEGFLGVDDIDKMRRRKIF